MEKFGIQMLKKTKPILSDLGTMDISDKGKIADEELPPLTIMKRPYLIPS